MQNIDPMNIKTIYNIGINELLPFVGPEVGPFPSYTVYIYSGHPSKVDRTNKEIIEFKILSKFIS